MALIRVATMADSQAIARIQVDNYRTAYAAYFPQSYLDRFTYEEETRDWQALLSAGNDDVLLVAENDAGEVAGYALGRCNTDESKPFDGTLVAIHVRLADQRQGLGRALLAAMARTLYGQGCASLWLSTLPGNAADAWYQRLRGERLGEERYQVDDTEVTEVYFGWRSIVDLL